MLLYKHKTKDKEHEHEKRNTQQRILQQRLINEYLYWTLEGLKRHGTGNLAIWISIYAENYDLRNS